MNTVFNHSFMNLLISVIVKLITGRNTTSLLDLFILSKFNNITVIRNNNIVLWQANYVLGHLGIMLKHIKLAVVWHVAGRLDASNKINVILKVGMARKMKWADISKVSFAILNYLGTLAQETIDGINHVWLVARNWVGREHDSVSRFDFNIFVCTGDHAI